MSICCCTRSVAGLGRGLGLGFPFRAVDGDIIHQNAGKVKLKMKKKMKIFSSVTVNIFWGTGLHFWRLYIFNSLVTVSKMYNLKNCLNLCKRMLTVIHVSWQVPARPRDELPKVVFRTE